MEDHWWKDAFAQKKEERQEQDGQLDEDDEPNLAKSSVDYGILDCHWSTLQDYENVFEGNIQAQIDCKRPRS